MNNYLVRAAAKWFVPVFIFMGVYLLLRGHNSPGGGFTGGLIFGSAFVIRHLAYADRSADRFKKYKMLILPPEKVIAIGLVVTLISGILGLLQGQAFLQGLWHFELWLPLVGNTKFGTPFYFDIAVFLVVAGTLNKIFQVMEDDDQWKSS